MEATSAENSQSHGSPPDVGDHPTENTVLDHANNDCKEEESNLNMNGEEIRGIMELIAATGKFWHDWDMLKSLLSFQLKQALAEYPESQMDGGIGSQQSSLAGETYSDLVKRLDEALLSFTEGPPFTLQRLCEILLAPKSIYPKLSKLALALEKACPKLEIRIALTIGDDDRALQVKLNRMVQEKRSFKLGNKQNLLVTSTLTKSTDPYPIPRTRELLDAGMENKQIQEPSYPVPGGVENSDVGDRDEQMAEADADDANADKDTQMQEDNFDGKSESGTDQNKV